MKSTMLRTEKSRVKQIKLSNWVYEVLRQTAEGKNQRISKGVIAVEALSMHPDTEYPHPLQSVEGHLDAELDDVCPGLADEINEIGGGRTVDAIKEQVAETAGEEGHGLPEDVGPDDMVEYQRKFWFPESVYNALPQRYVNREIEAALEYVIESAYHSLQSRINAKSEVLEYVARGAEPEHRVARAVCGVEDYDILSDVPRLDATGTNNSESSKDDSDEEWWDRDDLTLDDLRSREHTADGEGLTTHQRPERVSALETAMRNDIDYPSRPEAVDLVEEIYGVKHPTSDDYVADMMDNGMRFHHQLADIDPIEFTETLFRSRDKFKKINEVYLQAKVLNIHAARTTGSWSKSEWVDFVEDMGWLDGEVTEDRAFDHAKMLSDVLERKDEDVHFGISAMRASHGGGYASRKVTKTDEEYSVDEMVEDIQTRLR